MITTVEKLKKNLSSFLKDDESIYVLFFSKTEFEDHMERNIKDGTWLETLESIDDDDADQDISEQIKEKLTQLLKKGKK